MRMKKKMKKKLFKRGLLFIGAILLLLAIWQYELLYYGVSQARGQISVIWNARPVDEVLADSTYSDSLKEKIRLVGEIRNFAFDSLGLNRSDNYTSFYDQKGKPILWVLTASEPFALKDKEWIFPLIGSFSYKGFFDYQKALQAEEELKKQGYDTSVDPVEGWSTLGWFNDPILSNMLERTKGNLANVIIHELTHGTLYVKDHVQFNENLASFVGDQGAQIFLSQKFGRRSIEFEDYVTRKRIWKEYSKLVLENGLILDSLYNSFDSEMSISQKKAEKKELMKQISNKFKTFLVYYKKRDPEFYASLDSINNTYFLDFRRYREDQDRFEKELNSKFGGDFKAYFLYLREKYASL